MKYYFLSTRREKTKKSHDTLGKDMEQLELLQIRSTLENSFVESYTLNMHLVYLIIPILGCYPQEMITKIHIYAQGLYINVYSSFSNNS